MRLVVDCQPLSRPVFVDRSQWEKIVLNLLSNAFKYTLEGEIVVRVEERSDGAVLVVADTGVGIPREAMPRLFERFYRVPGARGRTHEGTGIGLALVQELLHAHGAAIEARSEVGRGTTFTVTLPFGSAHLPERRVGPAATRASRSPGANAFVEEASRWAVPERLPLAMLDEALERQSRTLNRAIVLLADDNADMRDYVRRILEPRHEVITVANGADALAVARAQRVDLVLSDVMMPRLDGFGLLRALRADPATAAIPVILLSARAGEEARIEGRTARADDYIVKPFSARELTARVEAALELARLRKVAHESLRESEERFRNMANSAPVMVWVAEPDGTCTFLSTSWYAFTGQAPENGLGRGWAAALHPDDRARVLTALAEANDRREPLRTEYRLRRADGEYRWMLDSAVPRFESDGAFRGFIGSVIDMTEQKRTETELLESQALLARHAHELQEEARRKDEFLAVLGHELRNPLAAIANGVRLADSPQATDEDRAWVGGMLSAQVRQMTRLLDDLLDMNRIARGRIALRKERIAISRVLEQAVAATDDECSAHGHRVVVDVEPEDLAVVADPARLQQVAANLLSNAARYSENEGTITVTARQKDDMLRVSVADTGIGLEAEDLERVFQPFTQLHRTGSKGKSGLGIGLSLVRSLVELHGGTVTVSSAGKGLGATFTVLLPNQVGPGGARATRRGSRRTAPGAGPRTGTAPRMAPGRARVLLVEDNVDAARALSLMLLGEGCDVGVAHDGEQALELASARDYDVALVDIGLPDMTGYDLVEELGRRGTRPAKSYALTGFGHDKARARIAEAGFDAHLIKPVDFEELLGLLRALAR